MEAEKDKKFDPTLVDKFFQEIGIYPVGTEVTLTNGFSAVVKAQNRKDKFRPIVEVIAPLEKEGTTIDLMECEDFSIIQIREET